MPIVPGPEPLSPELLQRTVVAATPDPARFQSDSDPAGVTLFDLGVVGATESAVFVRAVKKRLRPWRIRDSDVASSPGSTIQQSADSLAQNAY